MAGVVQLTDPSGDSSTLVFEKRSAAVRSSSTLGGGEKVVQGDPDVGGQDSVITQIISTE